MGYNEAKFVKGCLCFNLSLNIDVFFLDKVKKKSKKILKADSKYSVNSYKFTFLLLIFSKSLEKWFTLNYTRIWNLTNFTNNSLILGRDVGLIMG